MREETKALIKQHTKLDIENVCGKIPKSELIVALYFAEIMTIKQIAELLKISESIVKHHIRAERKQFTTAPKDIKKVIEQIVNAKIVEAGLETRLTTKTHLNKMINAILKEAEGLEWKSKGEAIRCAIELQKLSLPKEDVNPNVEVNISFNQLKENAQKILQEDNIQAETQNIIDAQYEVVHND